MAIRLNIRKRRVWGRLSVCLVLAAILLSQLGATGRCEDGLQALNASGAWNSAPTVDPIRSGEGFSSVLYNNTNGLPTSDANAIAQTSDGFLWIGSYAGLIRYDGNSFERIDSTNGIANVRCLFVDSRDRLWIGTNDSGVFLMSKGSLQQWDKEDGLRSVSIRSITEDEGGIIYIGSAAAGVAILDTDMTLTVLTDERLDSQTIPELRRGSDGVIYGITQSGDVFTLKDGTLASFVDHEDCRIAGIHCIMPNPGHPGRVYVGAGESEVYYCDLTDGLTPLVKKSIYPLSSVNSMESINGQIWICAANGIGRLDRDGFHALDSVPMVNSVEHVMTDYEGNLWFVSSHQGVMKIVRNQFSDLFERWSLPSVVVNSTCMYGQQLFIGTDSGLIVTEGDHPVSGIPLTKAVTASGKKLGATDLLELLDGIRIRSIVRDSQGRLWIPTWRRYGLLLYDHGEVTSFSQADGLISDSVRVISECEDGSILVANTGGVSVIRGDRVVAGYGEKEGIVNGGILTVTEGFDHEIVLGSDGDGIYIITPEGTEHIGSEDGLKSEIVLRVKRSRCHDVYWIVTGNSLAYMTPDHRVTTIQQFPYPNNYDLYENSKGDVWVLSSAGIYVISGEALLSGGPVEPIFYGMNSGLPYVASANASSELTDDGDLYIASSEGVVKVNIETPFENISEIKVALPYIDADGERCYPNESGEFILPASARKVTLYPYVFSYSLIDPQISYRMDGFDLTDETVSRSRLTAIDYTNLSLGSYRFIMTVKDTVGHSEQTVTFQIVKGKEMTAETVGTIIMDCASLLFMGGILVYTSVYRKRGRQEDKLFFGLLRANAALAAGELLSFLMENMTIPLAGELMVLGNTVLFTAMVLFPYLLLVYFDFFYDKDSERVRKTKLFYAIPFFLFFALLLINLQTGWLFSLGEGNVYTPGPTRLLFLLLVPLWLYFLFAMIKAYRVNRRVCALFLLLIASRLALDLLFPGISSTSFVYSLFLMIIYLYLMNRPLFEEAS